jgi:hypothetical protein
MMTSNDRTDLRHPTRIPIRYAHSANSQKPNGHERALLRLRAQAGSDDATQQGSRAPNSFSFDVEPIASWHPRSSSLSLYLVRNGRRSERAMREIDDLVPAADCGAKRVSATALAVSFVGVLRSARSIKKNVDIVRAEAVPASSQQNLS